jgi:hypothetical protein
MADLEGRVSALERRMDAFERLQDAHHVENSRKIDENTRITSETATRVRTIEDLVAQVLGVFKVARWIYRVVAPGIGIALGYAGHKVGLLP